MYIFFSLLVSFKKFCVIVSIKFILVIQANCLYFVGLIPSTSAINNPYPEKSVYALKLWLTDYFISLKVYK